MKWDFMIVLQDGSLPSVWEEAKGIRKLEPEQVFEQTHNGRTQKCWWVNVHPVRVRSQRKALSEPR